MEGRRQSRELLDVPGVANIERTLANLTRSKPSIGPAPRSSVLDRLGAFLPQLAQANAQLEQQLKDQPPSAFDIEQVEEDDGTYIEMDLACGVLELRDEAALRAAEEAMEGRRAVQGGLFGGGQTVDSEDEDDSDSDSDEESSSSDDDEDIGVDGEDAAARSIAFAAAAAALARGAGAAGQSGQEDSGMECDEGDGGVSASAGGADEGVEGVEAGVGRGGGGHGAGSADKGQGRSAKSGPRAGGMAGKGGAQQGRRRKVAAKRSNMIVELS